VQKLLPSGDYFVAYSEFGTPQDGKVFGDDLRGSNPLNLIVRREKQQDRFRVAVA
jgi:hypothetical protein